MNNNNTIISQDPIKIKTRISPVIRTMRPSNKVQGSSGSYWGKNYLLLTVMKANGILMVSGDDEIGQHVSPNNIPGPQ